jgi:carboxyl-terminal processing protease
VIKVDDAETVGLTLGKTFKLFVGAPGSTVRLTLARPGVPAPIVLTMKREPIRVTELRSKLVAPGIGYVRVSQFRETTPDSFAKALNALRTENGGALRGLALDLRNNPGGLLDTAIAIAAAFTEEDKLVVSMNGRNETENRKYTAAPQDYTRGYPSLQARMPEETRALPLVVLVNRASAAGSEIIAGALQDHKRAMLIGEKTYGRGSIQTIMPMADGAAIKLTTAYWQTPNGRPIHGVGIAPDVVLDAQAAKPGPDYDYGTAKDAGLLRAVEILRN